MNLNDFGVSLTFHKVPPAGHDFLLSGEISVSTKCTDIKCVKIHGPHDFLMLFIYLFIYSSFKDNVTLLIAGLLPQLCIDGLNPNAQITKKS